LGWLIQGFFSLPGLILPAFRHFLSEFEAPGNPGQAGIQASAYGNWLTQALSD
jgi:hypothetical protein